MVFLLCLLTILLIVLIITIIIAKAKISIEVKNLKIKANKKMYISDNYKIIFKIIILNKIPILKFNLNNEKLVLERNKRINKKGLKEESFLKNKIKKEILKHFSDIQVNKLNLKIKIGTENAFFTSMIIPIISSIISIILMKKITNAEKQKYIVEPIYLNQNILEILISGIFEMKMIHIINIIYVLNKERKVNKHERTSNRRSYDYGYE
ncbi:MAG: hypothetical protein KH434_01465 [Clostridium sp.]|nr:hypothetical protein [Clostridium sp.]MBS6251891.1 hypothetical protein [Clostridium sp.]